MLVSLKINLVQVVHGVMVKHCITVSAKLVLSYIIAA